MDFSGDRRGPGNVHKFAERNGYQPVGGSGALEFTARAAVIGAGFAFVNALTNMLFAFRYAGGLAQYWCILLAYPLGKATERKKYKKK
jgi:hypothetical protein